MKHSRRWNIAQSYEKEYWKSLADRIIANSEKQLTWYGWKAAQLEEMLEKIKLGFDKHTCKVLEIGSGPIGIVSYLEWGEKYALDPLNEFYKENTPLVEIREKSKVKYIAGMGEQIPFPDKYFTFVIIDNVLDHVKSPSTVLNEIHRVLSDDQGFMYLELNIHTRWGFILHSLLASLKIDKGHPYSYTAKKIRSSLNKHRFSSLLETIQDYQKVRTSDRKSPSLRAKMKGYSGLSEFIYSVICSK